MLTQDQIPSAKTLNLTYSKDENIYTVKLNTVIDKFYKDYDYVDAQISHLKVVNYTEYLNSSIRKRHKKQLKEATKSLRLKGNS